MQRVTEVLRNEIFGPRERDLNRQNADLRHCLSDSKAQSPWEPGNSTLGQWMFIEHQLCGDEEKLAKKFLPSWSFHLVKRNRCVSERD